MDSQALLEKHNPLLVIFPQEHEGRVRPGSNDPGPRGWGDYHPCSAEFFLAHALLRHKPGRWEFSKMLRPWGVLWGSWTATNPDGFEAIRQRVTEAETTEPESTREWELDVARIPSQDEKRAWQEYREMLNTPGLESEPVVYGRFIPGGYPILQYWYLYVYNDFDNNHEGDWEMVTVELGEDHISRRIGISSHSGGLKRDWDDPKVLKDRGHPMVYVGRGSHAGYFRYLRGGVKARRIIPRLKLPKAVKFLQPILRGIHLGRRRFWPILDHLAADPILDTEAREVDMGERFQPRLTEVPSGDPSLESKWWWLRFLGSWGSSHSRFFGTVGPASPWAASRGGQDDRWPEPVHWLDRIDEDVD